MSSFLVQGGKRSRDGSELFFENTIAELVGIAIDTARANPLAGNPQKLFTLGGIYVNNGQYDVGSDGRFLMILRNLTPDRAENAGTDTIVVVQNWFKEFSQ